MTSFNLKFSIDRSLEDTKYEKAPIGLSLERAMRYYSIRGKFHGVHPDLEKIGVKKIEINYADEKIGFIFSEGNIYYIIMGVCVCTSVCAKHSLRRGAPLAPRMPSTFINLHLSFRHFPIQSKLSSKYLI